jgi:hypothetical protein
MLLALKFLYFFEFAIAMRATDWVTQTILIIYASWTSASDSFTFVVVVAE